MEQPQSELISARPSFIWFRLNLRGEVVVGKKFSRKQLRHFTANLRVELIGMEACGGAHFLERPGRDA